MKKIISFMVVLCLILGLTLDFSLGATKQVNVMVDGSLIDFPDQKPFIEGIRTLVPIRFIAEELGLQVDWHEEKKEVSVLGMDKTIKLIVGESRASVNGKTIALDTAAKIVGNRTFVPLRFVSETMGVNVDWDEDTWTVLITTEEPKPKEGNVEIIEGIEFDRDRDVADKYGKMERSKALEFEMLVHNSYDFSDPKKLKGYLPELPEGYEWVIGFTVYYKEGSNVSASNSQSVGHGFDLSNTSRNFELELWGNWDQVERTAFAVEVRHIKPHASDGRSIYDKDTNEISVRDNNGNVLETIKK